MKAIFDFEPQPEEAETQLSFQRGDVIKVIDNKELDQAGWWYGKCKGRKGYFPLAFVGPLHDWKLLQRMATPLTLVQCTKNLKFV